MIFKVKVLKDNNNVYPKFIDNEGNVIQISKLKANIKVIKYDIDNNYCIIEISKEDMKKLKQMNIKPDTYD